MTTATKDFSRTVYVVKNNEIEEMSFSEYLTTYWNDDTTSPRGVENRRQVTSILLDEDNEIIAYSLNDQDYLYADEESGEKIMWGIFNWGIGGNHGKLESKDVRYLFESEEEANLEILRGFESDFQTKSTNNPSCYESEEEATEAIKYVLEDKLKHVINWESFKDLDIDDLNEIVELLKEKGVI